LLFFYLTYQTGWRFKTELGTDRLWNKYGSEKVTHALGDASLSYIKTVLPLGLIWLAATSPLKVLQGNIVLFIIFLAAIGIFFISERIFRILFRFVSYVLAMFLLLNSQGGNIFGLPFSQQLFHYILWGSLAGGVLIHLTATRFKSLETTPLDYLILLLVVSVPFLPVEQVKLWHLGTVTGGMVVFIWSGEVLLNSQKKALNIFSVSCLIAVVILALRHVTFIL
jgi:hypothetical protein